MPSATATKYEAVIFDLWGTLVPQVDAIQARALEEMALALDAPLTSFSHSWSAAWTARATGPLEPVLRRICRQLGVAPSESQVQAAISRRAQIFAEAFRPRRDARSTLECLRAAGVRIGLLTNCSEGTPEFWQKCSLAPFVDVAVFSCVERMMKPEPELYRRLCDRLGTPARRCLYVGDGSDDELRGAKAVGMASNLLVPGDTRPPEWEGKRVGTLSEIARLAIRA